MTKTEAVAAAGGVVERSEIAFFDVETTAPAPFAILEFGAILVCPKRLEEKWSYSTLVRPADPNLISSLSVRCNGITPDAVVSAPSFSHIADTVYDILHGRIWAGHNIQRFDCARIREAFAEIGRDPPKPKEIIDSLTLLTQRFGRRAGDMKMATLATYFGLGKQTHRSLDDVRMNFEVLKYCATVLFLESSLPEAFLENGCISPNTATRSRKSGKSPKGTEPNLEMLSSSSRPENIRVLPPVVHATDENHPILSLATSCSTIEDPFDMGTLSNEISADSFQPDTTEVSSTASVPEGSGGCTEFVFPDEVSTASISVSHVPYFRGSQRVVLLHRDVPLQLCCPRLKVRFGLSTKFVDYAGRPRLSFVVNAPPSLCKVLDACDEAARKLFEESGSSSDWRLVVSRKDGFVNYPTIRLNIPTNINGDIAQYGTEIYQHKPSGSKQKLVFSKSDAAELDSLIIPGAFIDVYLSLDPYDYQQNAGIKLVAKKIVLHNK